MHTKLLTLVFVANKLVTLNQIQIQYPPKLDRISIFYTFTFFPYILHILIKSLQFDRPNNFGEKKTESYKLRKYKSENKRKI